jgi:hypothetical protein
LAAALANKLGRIAWTVLPTSAHRRRYLLVAADEVIE